MPLVVDKEEVQKNIIDAFQECIKVKPLAAISMRDVAKQAHMSHQRLLYYFHDKNDLVYSYVRYAKDFFSDKCMEWFDKNEKKESETKKDYINRFLKYVAEFGSDENRPNATVQIYVMAQYDQKIFAMVQEMFTYWKKTMKECLIKIYGDDVGEKEAEAMMILISGTFLCNYNQVLSGNINAEILECIMNLSHENEKGVYEDE
jgi:AcrR family transcriptional regulator